MDQKTKQNYVQSLQTKGYIELKNIFSTEKLKRVTEIIEKPLNSPSINGSKGYIRKNNIRYLFATLSWSKDIIDLYTQPDIIDLVDAYVQDESHLSNFRIYRTFPSKFEKMHWHVDNKIDIYDEQKGIIRHELRPEKGIIFIMYLSDVEDGGFQIVESSHQWSMKENVESWNDRESSFQDKIITFNNKGAGTIVLYDYRCIHRAKPYTGGKIRTSLFGQYSPGSLPIGEPILLNTRDISNLSDQQKRVLNFGKIPSTENWPIGDPGEAIEDLGGKVVTSLLKSKAKKIVKRLGFARR